MSALDVLRFCGQALARHRRRSALSLVGVAIGVAAVLVLTAMGEGARGYVVGQFQTLGTNVLGILPGKVETSGGVPGFGGVPNDLTVEDARALERGVPRALHVAPLSMGNDTISHGGRSRQVVVVGSTASLLPIRGIELRSGTFLPEGPWDRGSPVVVVGQAVARELFPGQSPLGRIVRVGGWRMRVIGVLGQQGMHFGMNLDETVFVPVSTGLRMFDRTSLFRIALQVRSETERDAAIEACRRILIERHGEEDFTIVTPDAVLDALSGILAVLTLAVAGIGAVSLAVAGIGVMNVMLVSVSERTDEIGLLMALGASARQVLAVFLVEAVLLAAAGGLAGLGLGLGLVRAAQELLPAFPARAPWWALVAALGLSLAVGAVFGLLPARRAVRLDPVEALARR